MQATLSSSDMKDQRADQACARCWRSPLPSWGPDLGVGRAHYRRPVFGATRGLMAGHVAPEAAAGGPIAAVCEGDIITIDVEGRKLHVDVVGRRRLRARLATWKAPPPRYASGVMAKYARLVSCASVGAVTG